jgi:hypothetical protein
LPPAFSIISLGAGGFNLRQLGAASRLKFGGAFCPARDVRGNIFDTPITRGDGDSAFDLAAIGQYSD